MVTNHLNYAVTPGPCCHIYFYLFSFLFFFVLLNWQCIQTKCHPARLVSLTTCRLNLKFKHFGFSSSVQYLLSFLFVWMGVNIPFFIFGWILFPLFLWKLWPIYITVYVPGIRGIHSSWTLWEQRRRRSKGAYCWPSTWWLFLWE